MHIDMTIELCAHKSHNETLKCIFNMTWKSKLCSRLSLCVQHNLREFIEWCERVYLCVPSVCMYEHRASWCAVIGWHYLCLYRRHAHFVGSAISMALHSIYHNLNGRHFNFIVSNWSLRVYIHVSVSIDTRIIHNHEYYLAYYIFCEANWSHSNVK